jgi:hypothetical protein
MFNDRLEYMSVPDRGLFMLTNNDISYSKNEFLAIRTHDGLYDDANKSYLMGFTPETKPRTSIMFVLHQADLLAARVEFENEWLPKLLGPKPAAKSANNNFKLNKNANPVIRQKAMKQMSNPALADIMKNL